MGAFSISDIERVRKEIEEQNRRLECFELAPYTGELRDSNGFDLDGYDRDGFDRDGFDRFGFDREGHKKS